MDAKCNFIFECKLYAHPLCRLIMEQVENCKLLQSVLTMLTKMKEIIVIPKAFSFLCCYFLFVLCFEKKFSIGTYNVCYASWEREQGIIRTKDNIVVKSMWSERLWIFPSKSLPMHGNVWAQYNTITY